MGQQWIVALLSTDYDLKIERKSIINYLEENDIIVSGFEKADYPIISNVHSHDNCLEVLNRADIAILVINKRYGGKYYLNEEISITEAEFDSLEIPTLVLVNTEVWNERSIYRRQLKSFKGKREDFQYTPLNVEDTKVFELIDKIQGIYSSKSRSNWMNYWTDLDDLLSKIPLVLSALSATIINNICKEQIKEVKSKKTSTAFSLSLGDVIEKRYYLEPEYTVVSGSLDSDGKISSKINKKLSENESCMIIAEAGAGKTTLVAKSFIEDAENKTNSFHIPVYVWLKGKGIDYPFSISEFLRDGCEQYLRRQMYPFFKTDGFRFSFYLDGFDELAEKLTMDDLENIYSSEMFKWPVVLTSRIQYAEQYLSSIEFASKFSCQIKIEDWSEGKAKEYIELFCERQRKDESFRNCINQLLTDNEDLKDVLKSPLLVTILLYVIERNRMEIPETITSRLTLLQKCLEFLAQREIDTKVRFKRPIPTNKELVLQWAYFAWCVYEEKLNGKKGINISIAEDKINNYLGYDETGRWPHNIYDVLFDTVDEVVVGTFHEQFLEFLVAYCMIFACQYKKQPYPEFLKYVMRPEINRYFRGSYEQKTEVEQKKIIDSIHQLYKECAGSVNNIDIAKRVHAVYHLTRLSGAVESNIITRIFNMENEPAVRLSLYFGVIKKGDLAREDELFKLLSENSGYSNANRGYHLAYYDSLPRQKTLPYSDDSTCQWGGTLNAFLRHFESKDEEHYYLRRIDLITMRQLMEYRASVEPLTEEILLKLEELAINPNIVFNQHFQGKIIEEFSKVKETFYSLIK